MLLRNSGKTDAIKVGKKFINFQFLKFISVDDKTILRRQEIPFKAT